MITLHNPFFFAGSKVKYTISTSKR